MEPAFISLLMEFSEYSKEYEENQTIFFAGDVTSKIGIVMEGNVEISFEDFWGNKTIIDGVSENGIFAESYVFTGEPLMVNAVCRKKSKIAFVDVQEILSAQNKISDSDSPEKNAKKLKLLKGMLKIASMKNLNLSRKIRFTSPKSVRNRLTAYLSYQAKLNENNAFDIPFDRQQLADYLNVDRSAMSKELSLLRIEGKLETRKNHFVLK